MTEQLDTAVETMGRILDSIGTALGTMHQRMVEHGVSRDTADHVIAQIGPQLTAKLTGTARSSARDSQSGVDDRAQQHRFTQR